MANQEKKPQPPQQSAQQPLVTDGPQLERSEQGQVIVQAGAVRPGTNPLTGAPGGPQGPPPIESRWFAQASQYLTDNGWERLGQGETAYAVWQDPLGAGGSRSALMQVGELPKKGGGSEPLFQTVCPPARWDLPTEAAIATQRSRDMALTDEPSPLERISRQAKQIGALEDAQLALAGSLESMLKRAIPEKPENMRAEIILFRRAVQAAVERLMRGA